MRDNNERCSNIKKPKTSRNLIPSLDLLQARLERGEYLAKQDGEWHLFEADGEGVTSGGSLREILINLIWIDG